MAGWSPRPLYCRGRHIVAGKGNADIRRCSTKIGDIVKGCFSKFCFTSADMHLSHANHPHHKISATSGHWLPGSTPGSGIPPRVLPFYPKSNANSSDFSAYLSYRC